jgi:hypothetical protein
MYGMKGLQTPLAVKPARRESSWNGKDYELLSALVYHTKAGVIITVPKGFITDFASWIKQTGRYIEAAVIHDYLYRTQAGRKYADKIFKEVMTRGGCTRFRINLMYYGVRLFGSYAYYVSNRRK